MHHSFVVLLSIPNLRGADLALMPRLSALMKAGTNQPLRPCAPAVTCPMQVTLATGLPPREHKVFTNGFYHRDTGEVQMWTAPNSAVAGPRLWETLKQHDPKITSAVWFPLLAKGAVADYVCTPAPIHNPDGSESLWCYTHPADLYPELKDSLGHFPLMHYWGPLANIKSTNWIVDSAVIAAKKWQPRFSFIYLPHLDYAAQKFGPDSPQALTSVKELDEAIGRLVEGYQAAGIKDCLWLAASEYVITPVTGVSYPNRILRDAGWLHLDNVDGREELIPSKSRAWALVDHQFAHLFLKDKADIPAVMKLFAADAGTSAVLDAAGLAKLNMDSDRCGDVTLISQKDHWYAYYWWHDEAQAPTYARTVDIHRKPGYDPVELFFDPATRSIPLNTSLVKGSHGHPADSLDLCGVLLSSSPISVKQESGSNVVAAESVAGIVLRNFGLSVETSWSPSV